MPEYLPFVIFFGAIPLIWGISAKVDVRQLPLGGEFEGEIAVALEVRAVTGRVDPGSNPP